jgi:hypothetical protein
MQYIDNRYCFVRYRNFQKSTNKQEYWQRLTYLEKQKFIKIESPWDISVNGAEFNKLFKDRKLYPRFHVNQGPFNVGDIVTGDTQFIPVTAMARGKGIRYELTIPSDAFITISGDSLIKKYKADKVIIKEKHIYDVNDTELFLKQLKNSHPSRRSDGTLFGSVY